MKELSLENILNLKKYIVERGEDMRSPNWHEGELKLALDLYLSKDLNWLSRMSDTTFEIIAISKLLKCLDYYDEKPENFRSTGSIRMKLANFMALDKRYKMNSLGNVANLDKSIWEKYSSQPEELHKECIEIIQMHLVQSETNVSQYIELMKLNINDSYDPDFLRFSRMLKRALKYYGTLAEQNPNMEYADKVQEWCKKTERDLAWIEDVKTPIIFESDFCYKEHGGINLVPIRRRKQKIDRAGQDDEKDNEEKIGKLVQRTFGELVDRDKLSDEMIVNLLDRKYSKDTFGLGLSFLVQISDSKTLKEQVCDENGNVRYWIKVFSIHGNTYCVTKEWYPNQRERYLRWLKSVNIKPFFMVKAAKLKDILQLIQEIDNKKVSFTRKEIAEAFPQVEIEKVIFLLIEMGVLSGFQGSTKELVIDDYDALFRMLNNPTDYAME